jgi:hypothetical protein
MPIDFFSPTAIVLREAGAKPFNLFVILILFFYVVFLGKIFSNKLQNKVNVNKYLLGILAFGTVAFSINFFLYDYFSNVSNERTPAYQFFTQFSMFLMFIFVYQALTIIFSRSINRQYVLQLLPAVVLIHLLFIFFEFYGIFNADDPGILSLFRGNAGLIDRPSGLMSEPSYFGAFAGMYAIPLIFINRYNKINLLMALALILISLEIQAKTFIIVFAAQLLFIVLGIKKTRSSKFFTTILLFIFIGTAYYFIVDLHALNLQENLSSIMRIGSSHTAFNVATSGYGFLGIGFGQFHFFYNSLFSPDYLLLSNEALDQMANANNLRASTFSLPLRILVETGVCGLFVSTLLFYRIFRRFNDSKDSATQVGLLFLVGSLGFLFTQDTYCLPSLAFGLALVITQKNATLQK